MIHEPLFFRRGLDIPSAIKHISRQLPRNAVLTSPPVSPPVNPGPVTIRDPLFKQQWSIANNSSPAGTHTVITVWEKFGYTGQGTVVAVVDTDVRATHKDLAKNFVGEPIPGLNNKSETPGRPQNTRMIFNLRTPTSRQLLDTDMAQRRRRKK